jgi:hypothetical protein
MHLAAEASVGESAIATRAQRIESPVSLVAKANKAWEICLFRDRPYKLLPAEYDPYFLLPERLFSQFHIIHTGIWNALDSEDNIGSPGGF